MKSFRSSLICSWEEERDGEQARYSVTCTESESKLVIEMAHSDEESKSLSLSLEGFFQLAEWLEHHVGTKVLSHR